MALRVPGIPTRLLAPGSPDNEHLSRPGDTAQNPRTAHLRTGLAMHCHSLIKESREGCPSRDTNSAQTLPEPSHDPHGT